MSTDFRYFRTAERVNYTWYRIVEHVCKVKKNIIHEKLETRTLQ